MPQTPTICPPGSISPNASGPQPNPSQVHAAGLDFAPDGDEEIDLFELFAAVWRQKFLIAGSLLVCLAATAAYLFLATPMYEVSAQVRPGVTAYQDEKPLYGWSVEDIQSWIKNGHYRPYLAEAWSREGKPPAVAARGSRTGQFVTLTLRAADPEFGRQLLQQVLQRWIEDYTGGGDAQIEATVRSFQQEVGRQQDQLKAIQEVEMKELENRIAERTREMQAIEQKILLVEAQQRVQRETLQGLAARLEISLANTDELSRLRDQLIKKGQAEGLSFLIYSNIIQQNIYHVSDLQKRMADLQSMVLQYDQQAQDLAKQSADVKDAILQLQQRKAVTLAQNQTEVRRRIDLLEARAKMLAPIEVIARPIASERPVSPRPLLTLALAGVIGGMLGLLAAWVRNAKETRPGQEN